MSIRLVIIFFVLVGFGFLGFLSVTNYHSYVQERAERIRDRSLQFEIATSLWRYGVVESVDYIGRTLSVRLSDNTLPGMQGRIILVRTDSATTLSQQELVGDENVYNTLTAPTPIAFETLVPGTRVALLLFNIPKQEIIYAQTVIVGNPL